jgi:large subunit ribosomal protein L22
MAVDTGVRARARHVPISVRKPHAAAQPVAKLIRSAIANAEENFEIPREELYVARITADDGPGVMPGKGWRRRFGGRGRWRPIRKRSAHITLVLGERAADYE